VQQVRKTTTKLPRAQEDVAFLDDTAERTLWFFPDGLPASPGPMWDYKRIESGKLVPLEGEEIGQLIARAVEANATERRPWYEPMEKLPQERLINSACCANTTRSWSKCLREILCPPAAGSFWPGLATKPKHLDPARWLRGAPWILNQRTRDL
jgi:hypothetical protein